MTTLIIYTDEPYCKLTDKPCTGCEEKVDGHCEWMIRKSDMEKEDGQREL
jgi:hypothetical protein